MNFTQKLINLLVSGDMPKAKGKEAKESGLIIALSDTTTPVCASYGSSVDMAVVIERIMEQNEPIRLVLATAVGYFAKVHPNDPCITEMKEAINLE